jgi:MFS family permease
VTPDLIMLGITLLTWGIGEGMFFFFNPLYLQQLGADPIMIGSVLGVVGIAMTVAHIPAGYLADKYGRRRLLWIGWAAGLVAGWIMALASNLTFFIIGMIAYGVTAFVISPLNSYVTGARGNLTPARAMTLTSAMYNIGAVIGPLIGGWLGGKYGLKMTYLVASCLFSVSMVVILFLSRQPREDHDPEAPPVNLLSNRHYLQFMGIVILVMFATYLPQPLTQNFLQNERGLTLQQIGQLGSIDSFGIVVFNLILGQFDARFGFYIGQVAVALFTFLLWRGTGMEWYMPAYFLVSGYRVIRPLIAAQVRDLIHGSQMGLAYGITETINAIPAIIAPPIAGLLYVRDPLFIYQVSLVLIVFTLVISVLFTPRRLTDVSHAA